MIDTATINPRNRESLLGGVTPFAADLLPLVPEATREASTRLAEALARKLETETNLGSARVAMKAAQHEDRAAAKAAEIEGQTPPKPTAAAASAALATAQRAGEAATAVAQTRQHEFCTAVLADRVDILRAAEREIAIVGSESIIHLDAVEGKMKRTAAVRRLVSALGDGGGLSGRTVTFNPSAQGKQLGRDPLKREDRERLEALRASLGLER